MGLFGKSFKPPKIICTIGTTTDDENVMREMINQGMACARINTAYAGIADYKRRIDALRGIAKIPVILDLKGSQIRILTNDKYRIEQGDEFPVGFQKGEICFNYDFFDEIRPGDVILFENGTIKTLVVEKHPNGRYVTLRVTEAGENHLTNHMGVNIPGRIFKTIPLLTPKDKEVIDFALRENVEFLAISFVRSSQDVLNVKKIIESRNYGHRPRMIAKIEDPIGYAALGTIIKESKKDIMVMIGRGDLFVEAPQNQLAFIQKEIIKQCNKQGVPVIAATGLLESMQFNSHPTRSEVCDTANAALDGADWLMLSAETSNSRYPVEAVKTLAGIIEECRRYIEN